MSCVWGIVYYIVEVVWLHACVSRVKKRRTVWTETEAKNNAGILLFIFCAGKKSFTFALWFKKKRETPSQTPIRSPHPSYHRTFFWTVSFCTDVLLWIKFSMWQNCISYLKKQPKWKDALPLCESCCSKCWLVWSTWLSTFYLTLKKISVLSHWKSHNVTVWGFCRTFLSILL